MNGFFLAGCCCVFFGKPSSHHLPVVSSSYPPSAWHAWSSAVGKLITFATNLRSREVCRLFLEFAKCLKGFGGWTSVIVPIILFPEVFFQDRDQKKLWSAEYLYISIYISIYIYIYSNHVLQFAFFELFEPCILSKHFFWNTCKASPPSSVRKLLLGVMFLGCHWINPSEQCGHPQFFGLHWGFKKHHQ